MGENGKIALDPRLSMIARLVGNCQSYADIGCDHGRLGAFLLQTGQCRRATLTDISEPSLNKARRLIAHLGLQDRVDFRVGDGAMALTSSPEVAVIAGMGGATIAEIISKGEAHLGNARLVLQPNVAAPQLRQALMERGYAIADERIALDGRRCYAVIRAERGRADYSLKQIVVGPVLLERMPDELLPYAQFKLRVAQKALRGAMEASDGAQREALQREKEIWEEVCACLRR